jgi:lipopolysaccharide export system protein LptC
MISKIINPINLLLITLLIFSCSNETEKRLVIEEKLSEEPDQTAFNFSTDFIDSNRVKARLSAKRARIFSSHKETLIDTNVHIDFFSKYNNDRVSYLSCDSAMIDDSTKIMYAYGEVFVYSDSSKTTLKTSLLEWNDSTGKLYSPKFVTIENEIEIIEGFGFESDQKLDNYKIYKVNGVKKK